MYILTWKFQEVELGTVHQIVDPYTGQETGETSEKSEDKIVERSMNKAFESTQELEHFVENAPSHCFDFQFCLEGEDIFSPVEVERVTPFEPITIS